MAPVHRKQAKKPGRAGPAPQGIVLGGKTGKVVPAKVQKALEMGTRAVREQNWAEAVKHLVVVWDEMPDDIDILTVLAHALVQLGVREQALEILSRALKHNGATPGVCTVMLQMANEMGMFDLAVKIGHQLLLLDPDNAFHYVNVGSAYSGAKRYDEAIEFLQGALARFPETSDLWNVLAAVVRYRDGNDACRVFLEEALRLDPHNFKALNNLANITEDMDEAFDLANRASVIDPENPEPHLAIAQYLFRKGDLPEAFRHYAYRRSARRRQDQNITYTHKQAEWDGSSLTGKTILVTNEQGIGDEVMFSASLPILYEQAAQVIVGVDKRLVSIFQRRFPRAIVCSSNDVVLHGYRYRRYPEVEAEIKSGALKVDWAVPMGSIGGHLWQSADDIVVPDTGFLTADPVRAAFWKDRLAALGPGLKVGITWQSGMLDTVRRWLYLDLDTIAPILSVPNVHFINLQYNDVKDQVDPFTERTGIQLHSWEDTNLRADIEANLAIMANLDLVIGPSISTQVFAGASGCPAWWLTMARPWWTFGAKEGVPWAPKGRYFNRGTDTDWGGTVSAVAAELAQMANRQHFEADTLS